MLASVSVNLLMQYFLRDPSSIPPTKARSLILPFFAPSKLPSRESRRSPLLTTLLFVVNSEERRRIRGVGDSPLTGIYPNLDMETTKSRSNLSRVLCGGRWYGGKEGLLKGRASTRVSLHLECIMVVRPSCAIAERRKHALRGKRGDTPT